MTGIQKSVIYFMMRKFKLFSLTYTKSVEESYLQCIRITIYILYISINKYIGGHL